MQPVKTAQDRKNGPETAQKNGSVSELAREDRTTRALPKTHVGFWRARAERRVYSYEGKACEVPEYSVRMELGKIRRRIALGTAIKEEAAIKARDIYLSLVAKGWDATLADLAPKGATSIAANDGGSTVGDSWPKWRGRPLSRQKPFAVTLSTSECWPDRSKALKPTLRVSIIALAG